MAAVAGNYGAVSTEEPESSETHLAVEQAERKEKRRWRRKLRWASYGFVIFFFGILPFSVMAYQRFTSPGLYAVKHFSVFFIRHAEKPPGAYEHPSRYNHLSEEGDDRAKNFYPRLFCKESEEVTDAELCQFKTNEYTLLFAKEAEPPHYTMREIETLEPLAAELSMPIEHVTMVETDNMIVQSMALGRVIGQPNAAPIASIICWEHNNMRHVARHFGCTSHPEKHRRKVACPQQTEAWPDEDFGSVVEFIFSYTDANPEKTKLTETIVYLEGTLTEALSV